MLPSETHQKLREVFQRCQRRYPTIRLSWESFRARVEEVAAAVHREHTDPAAGSGEADGSPCCSSCLSLVLQLHHEDLFLAQACAQGDRIAWEYFAEEYLALLRRFAAHACRSCEASEDLAHEILIVLLGESLGAADQVGRETRGEDTCDGNKATMSAPKGKLQSYNGRGSLAGWLRAAVSHAAIDRFRRARKQVSLDELLEQGSLPGLQSSNSACSAEERLDAHWGPKLAQAVQDEISRLGARDRLLLSLYHLQGVSLKAIGSRFGVHEATASRWLDRVRRGVRNRVEGDFQKRHGISAHDIESLWHWIAEAETPVTEPVPAKIEPQKKMQGSTP